MRWEDRLLALFDDLEQQAEGLALAERDAEVAERGRAEYAQVDLAARLHASVGSPLVLGVSGVGTLDASLRRVGRDWCLVEAGSQDWVVRLTALAQVRGLSGRAVAESARPLAARLGLGSALRRLAEDRSEVVVHRSDGTPMRGVLGRIGADFLEVSATTDGPVDAVAFAHLSAVRRG